MPATSKWSPGEVLWEPSPARRRAANLTEYATWLERRTGTKFQTYEDMWRWSVTHLGLFWESIWHFFDLQGSYDEALIDSRMPGAKWFTGASLNYAEYALRRDDDHPAVVFRSEGGNSRTLTYRELNEKVVCVAAALRELGVRPGDTVAAYVPNVPEVVVCFLATARLGAVWAACSLDFGAPAAADRFRILEPKVLIASDKYEYGGKVHERVRNVIELQRMLPSVEATILISENLDHELVTVRNVRTWSDVLANGSSEAPAEHVSFDHPLWVLYSSGTTGPPKAITHGHGGIILEHLKALSLHFDLRSDDRFFWYTTTGWMMWNFLVSGLLVGATIILYDGSPAHPDSSRLWRLAEEEGVSVLGVSAPYIHMSMKERLAPERDLALKRLRTIGSTGTPLSTEGFSWIYENVKEDVLLAPASGGTDICSGFVGPCPIEPVRAGEMQCRFLGAKVEVWDQDGHPIRERAGELVVTEPLPSMPVKLWGDLDSQEYRKSYFDMFPGTWRHGDWAVITRHNGCIIYGRSDSTLNRGGVRIGTGDFYGVVERFSEILDSLVIDTSGWRGDGEIILFVVLPPGMPLTEELRSRIRRSLRKNLSPRHVPDHILSVSEVPKTVTGKKLEVPIKRVLVGMPVSDPVAEAAVRAWDGLTALEGVRALQGEEEASQSTGTRANPLQVEKE